MAFGRFHRAQDAPDVNLIPVMNLFVILIPFLLLSAAFFHVGVIPTSLPSQTDGTSDIAGNPRSITVNLVILPEEIQLSASNAVLEPELLSSLGMNIPLKDGEYDIDLLQNALYSLKIMFAESDTVILLPGEGVKYHDVVRILDAARELKIEPDTPKETVKPLFPVAVMSRKV